MNYTIEYGLSCLTEFPDIWADPEEGCHDRTKSLLYKKRQENKRLFQ